jgi:hypothetical protein
VSGDICRDFTAELLALLTEVFAEAAAPRPGESAQLCLATAVGLLATDRTDLLRPATDALVSGLGVPGIDSAVGALPQ